MPTQAIHGKNGECKIGTVVIAEVKEWSLDFGKELQDVSSFDSNGWKEFIQGLGEWSGSFNGNWYMGDTNGQLVLQNTILSTDASVALRLYVNQTNYYSGTAYIKSIKPQAGADDPVKVSFEFQGTGSLSYT